MTIRVGINGFGRIGRLVFRAAQERNDIEIVGINDLIDVDYMAYMLRYDTMHGQFKGSIEVKDGKLVVNGKAIRVTAEKNPADLKWKLQGSWESSKKSYAHAMKYRFRTTSSWRAPNSVCISRPMRYADLNSPGMTADSSHRGSIVSGAIRGLGAW